MDETVQARIAAATDKGATIQILEGLLALYGGQPVGDELRERLVVKLNDPATVLKREQLLLRLLKSPDQDKVRAATARLAALLKDARRPELAAIYYRKLAADLADQPCLDGQTGSQLVAAIPADSAVRQYLADPKPWPVGIVEAKTGGKPLANNRQQRPFELDLHGDPGPFFKDVTVMLDGQQSSVVAQDGLGNERFRVSLAESQGGRRGPGFAYNGYNNPALNYSAVYGDLLLVWMGHHIIALDTLRGKESPGNRVLWSQDLQQTLANAPNQVPGTPHAVNVPWGLPRYVASYSYGRPIGNMGPPSDKGVCFQRFRDLVCVDPLTGEELWTRKNLPLGCDLFGDDEVLIAAPTEGGEAWVLRALDGELLGKRTVPPLEQRMASIGRLLLTWQPENGKQVAKLTDLWENKIVWSRPIDNNSKGYLAGQEALGIFEPGGRFSLIRIADGQVLVDHEKLHLENSLNSIYLFASPDAYVLVTNGAPTRNGQNENIQPAPGGLNQQLVSGRVYGFDRVAGKRLWGPVRIDQYGLVLSQPAQLPVLTFARHVHRATPNGQPDARTSMLCIDKRSGRIVFNDDKVLASPISNYEQVGDRADSTVSLLLPNKTVTLKFTDQEPPPETPQQQAGKAKPGASKLKSAAEAIGKVLEGALRPLDPAAPGEKDED